MEIQNNIPLPETRKRLEIKVGEQFGKLTVIKTHGSIKGNTFFVCQCTCGKQLLVMGHYLKNGSTKNCNSVKCRNKVPVEAIAKKRERYYQRQSNNILTAYENGEFD